MSSQFEIPELSEQDSQFAPLVAMIVRNAMEDFHVAHLSDAQMAELNPILRNAIATALHARTNFLRHRAARSYLAFQEMLVPSYWDAPELLSDYLESWSLFPDAEYHCQRCGRLIVNISIDASPKWTHLSADGGMNVGCRAASFTPGGGWDESLDRAGKAMASTGTRVAARKPPTAESSR